MTVLSMMKPLYDIKVSMRDGVRLSADLFLPEGDGRYPAIFNMTPYGTIPGAKVMEELAARFVRSGYAYVAVDVRGRYDSEGEWYAHPPGEGGDGSDVISWIAAQPWSDGRVVTIGHSYSGWNQWLIARERNPHHVAMISSGSPADLFVDWPNLDSVLTLHPIATWALGMMSGRDADAPLKSEMPWERAMWHLPLSDLDRAMVGRRIGFWQDWLERDRLDEFWQPLQMTGTYDAIQIPTFNVSGWYDGRLKGQVAAYLGIMRTTRNPTDHVLLIGPWLHSPIGQAPKFAMRDFGPQGDLDVDAVRLRWLEHVVKGNPRQSLAGALYFLQVANEWRQASAWPIPGTSFTKYYLDSAGAANTLHGDGFLRTDHAGEGPADRFVYDPAKPVLTNWSPTRANGILPTQPQDNRGIEERPDVLVYSTPQLATEMEVTGPLTATIYFSTDVPDTDITVKLLEVDADGVAYQLSYGIARARYRQSYAEPRLLEPGQVYVVNIELQPTSNYFKAGHRIRVEVSSSNFPFYARNLNTGANNNTTTEMRVAHTQILHSPEHPSHIVLPIVPAESTETVHFDEHRRA